MSGAPTHAKPLVLDCVTLTFGGIRALSNVSFTVAPGTVHAVIGPNGAGKSSTFNVVSGLYRATSGSITYGDEVLSEQSPNRIARLGIGRTFQNIALTASDTVLDNVMVGRHRLTRTGYLSGALGLPSARREENRHRSRVMDIPSSLALRNSWDDPPGHSPTVSGRRWTRAGAGNRA